jgi:oxygen-independent coproporphyrinogen-3 oxidase
LELPKSMTRRSTEPSDELLARYDVSGPRYTSYPTVPEWSKSFGGADLRACLERAGRERPDEPLSLYAHLPFCHSLCWYCGCNVVIARQADQVESYLDTLTQELDLVASLLGKRRKLSQIHWGGGTPTYLSLPQIERLWKDITGRFTVLPDAEVAIEVHPAHTSFEQLGLLRALGFNRVSMGLQDFDPSVQHATGRIQTFEQTAALLEHARKLGFSGINFDLIYGLPKQNPESWARTLQQVLSLRPDRLAVYSFAYMPEVLKHQKRLPAEAIPKAREKLGLLLSARNAFLEAGYAPIGMDHFALPTDELAVAQLDKRLGRNFQGYTVRAADEVVAVGTTGISQIGGAYAQNVRAIPRYAERIAKGELATERGAPLTDDDDLRRAMINNLMCNFGVDLGEDAEVRWQAELERLAPLEQDGLVERRGPRLEVTELGQIFVRNVAMAFDSYLARAEKPRFSRTV